MSFDVQNAADIDPAGALSIMAVGPIGAGKTSLIGTLPGRTFAILFDPNAEKTLRGFKWVDFEGFYPEALDKGVKPLSSQKTGDKGRHKEPTQYRGFEDKWNAAIESGFFDKYDNIVLDSLTSFQAAVMDRAQYLSGSLGRLPERGDYSVEMTTTLTFIREMAALRKTLYVTAHVSAVQDETTGRTDNQIMATGKNRIHIPSNFTDILRVYKDKGKDGAEYVIDTVGPRTHPYVRCSLQPNPGEVDVTIDSKEWGTPAMQKRGLSALYSLGKK